MHSIHDTSAHRKRMRAAIFRGLELCVQICPHVVETHFPSGCVLEPKAPGNAVHRSKVFFIEVLPQRLPRCVQHISNRAEARGAGHEIVHKR